MKIFNKIPEKHYFNNPVVTIGTFDGVHIGHQKIFNTVKNIASRISGDSIVLTFSSHPRKLINPDIDIRIISTADEKVKAIENFGIKYIMLLDFSRDIADLDAREFFSRFLVDKIGAVEIVIGYDHAFGKNREGNIELLKELSSTTGIGLTRVGEESLDGRPVSSTWLRSEIQQGNIPEVISLLGRKYSFSGKVVKGTGRGKKLGFPTANIIPDDPDKIIPGDGVYAVSILFADNTKKFGLINIGYNPTFSLGRRSIEVNIFDFDRDIYGSDLTIEFFNKIRDEVKFKSVNDLVKQIKNDKKTAVSIFNK